MPKVKSPPVNLDQSLKGREHHYMSYEDGARMCGLPYWRFVKMAKDANAIRKVNGVVLVNTEKIDAFIEGYYGT